MTDAIPELKPCPFCGGRDIQIRATKIGDYFAICHSDYEGEMHCGASTDPSRCETEEGARSRWNQRAYSATALERVVRERDEALADLKSSIEAHHKTSHESVRRIQAIGREKSAVETSLLAVEAKLAEALNVIADLLACPAIADGNHSEPAWADHETIEAERAARRFLEGTK